MKVITEKKIYSLLGLAERAGRIASGSFMTEEAVQKHKAELVVVAADAGENTGTLFRNKCAYYHVPLRFFGTREALGRAIGKEFRSCLAVTDPGFAAAVLKLADEEAVEKRGRNGNNEEQ